MHKYVFKVQQTNLLRPEWMPSSVLWLDLCARTRFRLYTKRNKMKSNEKPLTNKTNKKKQNNLSIVETNKYSECH